MMESTPRLRLGAAYTSASQLYTIGLAPQTSLGTLAKSVAWQAGVQSASTFEIAVPMPLQSHLYERAAMAGDRLLIQTAPPKPADWIPPQEGQPTISIQCNDLVYAVTGQHVVTIGKASSTYTPDADITSHRAAVMADFISEQCLELRYTEADQAWYVTRTGHTRIRLQEFELSPRIPLRLTPHTTLQLYPPTGSILPPDRLLAEISIHAQSHTPTQQHPALTHGDALARVIVGTEHSLGMIETSGILSVEAIARELLTFHRQPIPARLKCYLVRAMPPDTPLAEVTSHSDNLLYMARDLAVIRSVLHLRSPDQDAVYTLYGGPARESFSLGTRLQQTMTDSSLDIDLYDLLSLPLPPSVLPHLGYTWVQFYYEPDANAWWISSTQHPMPVFLDGRRLGTTPVRVTHDRVLSIGIEGTALIFRFLLELATR